MDGNAIVLRNLPPEVAGALCSRASRAKESLPRVLLKDFWYPILDGKNRELAEEFEEVVRFFHRHNFRNVLNAKRAEGFFARVLAQYGDDSVAQTTGAHLCFGGISQVAMKFIEDQRIGLEPIEKSTRYVNFGQRQVNSRYLYYTPEPELRRLGVWDTYTKVLDGLFETYNTLLPRLQEWIAHTHPEGTALEIEKKAFDTLRGLLPMATLGQVGFRANGQAFEYLINRSRKHELGEIRWISHAAEQELDKEIPSLISRAKDEKAGLYQEYLANSLVEVEHMLQPKEREILASVEKVDKPGIRIVWHDDHMEEKIVEGILFSLPHTKLGAQKIRELVDAMPLNRRAEIIDAYLNQRSERWYKLGRAFENISFLFEIVGNIGMYRDLHRHRLLTQDRQPFTIHLGYTVPAEINRAGLENEYRRALDSVVPLYKKLEQESVELAQYVVPLAYHIRFYQHQSMSSIFWTIGLRTTSQGHPDYRKIEQEKYLLVLEKLPSVAKHVMVDLEEYFFTRRGEEKKIEAKEKRILERLQ